MTTSSGTVTPIWYKEQWKEYYSRVKLLKLGILANDLSTVQFFSLPFMFLCLYILACIHFSQSLTFFFVPRFLFPASPSRLLRENWVITSWLNCPKVNPAASKILLPSPRPLKQHAQLCIPQSPSTFKRSGGAARRWARRNPRSTQAPRLASQLEERYDFEKVQASGNPAPAMTGRRQLGAQRGHRSVYAAH